GQRGYRLSPGRRGWPAASSRRLRRGRNASLLWPPGLFWRRGSPSPAFTMPEILLLFQRSAAGIVNVSQNGAGGWAFAVKFSRAGQGCEDERGEAVIPGWCASTRPGISRFSGAQLRTVVRSLAASAPE